MEKKYRGPQGDYIGMDETMHQEMKDSSMIRMDHSSIANMPQTAFIKEFPKRRFLEQGNMDDTIMGIDSNNEKIVSKARKHYKPRANG